jgi:hypothetical protein
VQKELKELIIDFNERLKHEVIPKLFEVKKNEILNKDVIGFLTKYNIVMSQASLKDASDSDFVKGMASFGVVNFTKLLLDHHSEYKSLDKLSRPTLSNLLQLPFSLLE